MTRVNGRHALREWTGYNAPIYACHALNVTWKNRVYSDKKF
jgi:hypothetical protein